MKQKPSIMNTKHFILLAALGLTANATFTSCDEILGEWSRPVPVKPAGAVAVTSITLSKTLLTMNVGDAAVTLTATVAPDNATDKTITWSSNKESVAKVADGVVTIVGAGIAIITATANDGSGFKATCNVNVVPVGALAGRFSVSDTEKVWFSKGNLQATYNGTAWTWAFATNQWDHIGNAEGNTKVSGAAPFVDGYTGTSTSVDLFGWVGASSTVLTSDPAKYGIYNSTTPADYGISTSDVLMSDWGKAIDPSGTTWRTPTKTEWDYLINTRSASTVGSIANARYCKATVNSVSGLVLFPDNYIHPAGVIAPADINTPTAATFNSNTWSGADWTKMETVGCVFLPVAYYREGATVEGSGKSGSYWSASSDDSNANYAYYLSFDIGGASYSPDVTTISFYRNLGHPVRLVRNAE